MLSESMITAVSRHLNVPVMGVTNNNFSYGLAAYDSSVPFYQQPGALSDRLLNLRPDEESVLTGLPIAQIILTGTASQSSAVTVSATGADGSAVTLGTYVPTLYDLSTIEPLFQIASSLMLLINMANTPYVAQVGPHSPGNGPLAAAQATLTIQSLLPSAFTLSLVATSLGAYVASQGAMPSTSQTFFTPNGSQTVYGLVPVCDYLEMRIASSADVAQLASVNKVAFAQDEFAKRVEQYGFYRRRLANFFFGNMGSTFLSGGRRGRGAIA